MNAVQIAHIRLLINGDALTLSLEEARELLRVLQDAIGDPPLPSVTWVAPLAPWPQYPAWTYTVANTTTGDYGGTLTLTNNTSNVSRQW